MTRIDPRNESPAMVHSFAQKTLSYTHSAEIEIDSYNLF